MQKAAHPLPHHNSRPLILWKMVVRYPIIVAGMMLWIVEAAVNTVGFVSGLGEYTFWWEELDNT